MRPQRNIRRGLKNLFGNRTEQEQLEAGDSSSTTPAPKSDVQVTESFPVGVKEWVKCDDAEVDICFVHGLTGNRDSTWTAKGQMEPWPKKLLPVELPNLKARIFTYGYDAYIIRWGHASSNQLTDHSMNFLQKVTADREKNNASDRPLIIIAHSLGGLVTKQAILKSKSCPEAHLQNLYNMTKGVIFMGTPHTGSWIANWVNIPVNIFGILKSTNTTLLRVLQTDDELLLSLNADFLYLLRALREGPKDGKKINVICFFEELGYPKFGHIVAKASATFASDPPISVHANHSDMVKFASIGDEGFQSVAAELRRWINESRKALSYHLKHDLLTSPHDPVELILQLVGLPSTENIRKAMKACLKSLNLEGDAEFLLKSWELTETEESKRREKIEQRVKDVYRAATVRCYRSLSFKDMVAREEIIVQPEIKTCQWIYQHSQYKEWVTNEKPLLWIKGIPGAGKSILMKSLFKRRQQDLENSPTILLRFFFNGRGSDMEKSREALYRTLLHGFINASPILLCEILVLYLEKEARGDSIRWQTTELAEIFHDKLEQFQSDDIEILIDALDECSDAEVLQVVRRFERSIQAPRNHTALRVCWSSRFYPNISLIAMEGIELVVNKNNTRDIREYVQKVFPINSHESLRSIGEDIISRARGTFLWASLVADKLIKSFDAGKDAEVLKTMLDSVPDDLDNYFMEIFNESSFTIEQRKDLQRIAPLIFGASRALSIEELYTALILESPSPGWSFHDVKLRSYNMQQFRKRLTHASGGLIEVVEMENDRRALSAPIRFFRPNSSHNSKYSFNVYTDRSSHRSDPAITTRVQVIHESVLEFFLGKGLTVLQASPSKEVFWIKCHSAITRAGLNGLSIIASDIDATKHHESSNFSSTMDQTLNALVPRQSWRPPEIEFLVSYVRDYIFTHFVYVTRCVSVDTGDTTSWLPPATVCQQALFAYLRISCFEVIQYGYVRVTMNNQLRIVSAYAEAFKLDSQAFTDLIDFPNRLMATSEFLKRRGIYLFENISNISSPGEEMHRFLAAFSATTRHLITDSPPTETSLSAPVKNSRATVPNIPNFFPLLGKASEEGPKYSRASEEGSEYSRAAVSEFFVNSFSYPAGDASKRGSGDSRAAMWDSPGFPSWYLSGTVPEEASEEAPEKAPEKASEEQSESSLLLFGISILIPISKARRLMLQDRLSLLDPHYINREDAILAVDIDDWQFVSADHLVFQSLPFNLPQGRPGGQLIFSGPSHLTCSLFHWHSTGSASPSSEIEPVLIQSGECAFTWQPIPGKADYETLFKQLNWPGTWAVRPYSHSELRKKKRIRPRRTQVLIEVDKTIQATCNEF